MVNLAFPNAIMPTNTQNKVEYSQLQTQNRDLVLIQDNISEYTENLAKLMSQKDNYLLFAQNNATRSVTTPTSLTLSMATADQYQTYDTTSGVFIAPQDGVYSVSVYGVATPTSGSPTVIYIDIQPSNGPLLTQAWPILAGVFYVDLSIPFQLQQSDTLSFALRTDSISTLTLSASWRLSVLW